MERIYLYIYIETYFFTKFKTESVQHWWVFEFCVKYEQFVRLKNQHESATQPNL